MPHTEHRILRADPRLVNLALATPVAGQRVVTGRILTGDQFVSDPDDALRPPVGVESPGAAGHRRNRLCATRRQETVWGARPTRALVPQRCEAKDRRGVGMGAEPGAVLTTLAERQHRRMPLPRYQDGKV